ncbi:MAG TPA: hypothetical protein VJT74_09075 [Pyrinomonadaceae bacterium]|nr:hypothetical protein [Pyrinomonadaceae bacterium]
MRRTLAILLLLAVAALWSACGGSSNPSSNAGRDDVDTTVNSERIDSSNMAPTGGPGPEPENGLPKSSSNANTSDKKQPENKNKNSQ